MYLLVNGNQDKLFFKEVDSSSPSFHGTVTAVLQLGVKESAKHVKSWVASVFISLNQKVHVEIDDLVIEPLTVLQGLDVSSGDLQLESATQVFFLGSWTQCSLDFLFHFLRNVNDLIHSTSPFLGLGWGWEPFSVPPQVEQEGWSPLSH